MMNPYEIVRALEEKIAAYAGSRFGVAVDSATSALFLCCRYLEVEEVRIPSRTYFSVPCQILHAGGRVLFEDVEWGGMYQLKPYPIWDSALRFRAGMYPNEAFVCLSFDIKKHLKIGRGGMILTDDEGAARWFRLARFHGRHEVPRMEDFPEFPGWKMHMFPEDAIRGLALMAEMPDDNADIILEYPDLSRFGIYEAHKSAHNGRPQKRTDADRNNHANGILVPFDVERPEHIDLTYRLLQERYQLGYVNIPGETPGVGIDPLQPHPDVPTHEAHVGHLRKSLGQYDCTYIWQEADQAVAFLFLRPLGSESDKTEIGIFVLKDAWGRGVGTNAVTAMLERHPTQQVVARINPANYPSNQFFEHLGFRQTCNIWTLDQSTRRFRIDREPAAQDNQPTSRHSLSNNEVKT